MCVTVTEADPQVMRLAVSNLTMAHTLLQIWQRLAEGATTEQLGSDFHPGAESLISLLTGDMQNGPTMTIYETCGDGHSLRGKVYRRPGWQLEVFVEHFSFDDPTFIVFNKPNKHTK